MREGRGLTLVEVLAATVLLAILAATCMPLLQRAMRALETIKQPFELLELAQFADSLLADPSAFGVEAPSQLAELQLSWPEQPDRSLITVRRLSASDPESDHAWLTFSCGGRAVYRWVPLEPEPEERVP